MEVYRKGSLIKTVGWVVIGVGVYLVHKGIQLENTIEVRDYIDAEFEIIE